MLNTTIGLLNNYVEPYQNPLDENQLYGDREPAHSPEYTYSFKLNYFLGEKIIVSVEVSGMDDFYFEDQYHPKSKPYNIFNSNIAYNYNKWCFTIWGKNILDEKYATRGYYFDLGIGNIDSQSYRMYGQPLHYGIKIKYQF